MLRKIIDFSVALTVFEKILKGLILQKKIAEFQNKWELNLAKSEEDLGKIWQNQTFWIILNHCDKK